jgi:hypothetical protein
MVLAVPSTPTTSVRGAASNAIAELVIGPAAPGRLIGTYPVAAYIETAYGVVAVVTPEAVRLPNAIVVTAAGLARVGRAAGDRLGGSTQVVVGDGGIRVGDVRLTISRWWDPVPRVGAIDGVAFASRLARMRELLPVWPDAADPAADVLVAGRDRLRRALVTGQGVAEAVRELVGLGPGLTPAGDDVIAGTIAGLAVFGGAHAATAGGGAAAETVDRLAEAAAEFADRTTVLAADLTRLAARGAGAEPVAGLCHALSGDRAIEPAVQRLVEIGHTSGRDLAEGLLLTLTSHS